MSTQTEITRKSCPVEKHPKHTFMGVQIQTIENW